MRVISRVIRLNYDVLVHVHRDHARGLPCLYCWAPMDRPTWDHVIPRSKGGPNTRGNLVVVCARCNCDKGDLSLLEYEGYLIGFGHQHAKKIRAFRDWITRDWPQENQDAMARQVAHAWAEAQRVVTQRHAPMAADKRAFLGRLFRTSVLGRQPVQDMVRMGQLAEGMRRLEMLNAAHPIEDGR